MKKLILILISIIALILILLPVINRMRRPDMVITPLTPSSKRQRINLTKDYARHEKDYERHEKYYTIPENYLYGLRLDGLKSKYTYSQNSRFSSLTEQWKRSFSYNQSDLENMAMVHFDYNPNNGNEIEKLITSASRYKSGKGMGINISESMSLTMGLKYIGEKDNWSFQDLKEVDLEFLKESIEPKIGFQLRF